MKQELVDAYLYARRRMTATRALEVARADVAAGRRRYPRGRSGGNWQSDVTRGERRAYYANEWPLRLVGRADEVCRDKDSRAVRHKGWYTVDDGWDGNTIAGYVLLLPHGRYVPGWAASDWDGVTLYPTDIYDDAVECAIAADRLAETAAEQERDYQRAHEAGREAGEKNEEACMLRTEIRDLAREVKVLRRNGALNHSPVVDGHLCLRLRAMLDDLYTIRRERDALRDEVPRRLIDAFNDGFANA
jgi:hypothetical protein